MKRFVMLVALVLCITILFAFMNGCSKTEKAEQKAGEVMEEVQEEAAVDTTAVDTVEQTMPEE